MGALYWQLNDDWPVVSWSSVDYYNNWKAQHYKMRDVFAPIALGSMVKNNQLSYMTMSDKLEDVNNLTLNVQVIDFSGKKIAPFITHEGSALGKSVADLKTLCPGATILDGLAVRGGRVQNSQAEIDQWLKRLDQGK